MKICLKKKKINKKLGKQNDQKKRNKISRTFVLVQPARAISCICLPEEQKWPRGPLITMEVWFLRATVCKYRRKSTFCGTTSKFEFRSFLAHR